MTTTIKITELTNIGANLDGSTVFPVVNMSGTPTTQKTVLGNIANTIFAGAGTDYVSVASAVTATNATVATRAGTVTTAAQPNITSTGSLTGLTVSNASGIVNFTTTANVTLGAVGNLHIAGGSNGQVLTTNGSGGLSWTSSSGSANTGNIGFNDNIIYSLDGSYLDNSDLTHDATAAFIIPTNGGGNVEVNNTYGNILIQTGVDGTFTGIWNFDNTGNLQVPGNIVGPASANFTIYANAGAHEFVFGDDGTFYAPDNVVLGGNSIYIGPGANTLDGIEHEVFIASSNLFPYVQAVINNISDQGSADWVALGARGGDEGGTTSFGFTSSGFSDGNYTITGHGDGYVLVQSYAPGQTLLGGGGNLVLATGSQGTTKDIIFGTGGFLTANIFGRISDANNSLELTRTGASLTFPDGSIQTTAYTGGGGSYGNSNVANYLPTYTGNIAGGNANITGTIRGNSLYVTSTGTAINASSGNILTNEVTGTKFNFLNGSYTASINAGATANYTLTLPTTAGSNGQVLTTNGSGNLSWTTVSGGGGGNTGNVTFDDQIVIGTGDEFGGGGLYLAPGPAEIANGQYLQVRGGDQPSHIHFDTGNNNFYDQYFGNDNKYVKLSAGADGNILIGTDDDNGNLYRWNFDSAGNTTVPGNIKSITTGFSFNANINGINTSTANVVLVSLTSSPFGGPFSGQVTISDVVGTTVANGTWYFEATEANEFQLYYDEALDYPVDGTGWNSYVSGGSAVAAGYSNLSITGGNVSIINNNSDAWTFANNGSIIFPTLTVNLHNGGDQDAQVLQFGNPDYQAVITGPAPSANINAQRLIIQGQYGNGQNSEGGDVYVWAGDADLYGGDIKIYAGDADNGAEGYGGYINIAGGSGFNEGGYINIDGGQSANGAGAYVSITGGGGNTAGGYANVEGGQGTIAGGQVNIKGGYGGGSGGNVNITGGVAGNGLAEYGNVIINSGASTWTFNNDGTTTLPNYTLLNPVNEDMYVIVQDDDNDGWSLYNRVNEADGTTLAQTRLQRDEFSVITDYANLQYTWTFDDAGRLTLPGNINGVYAGNTSIYAVNDGSTGSVELKTISYLNDTLGSNVRVTQSNATISTANAAYTWTFDNTGSFIFPGAGVSMDGQTNLLLTSGIANATINTFVQGADGGVSWEYQGDGEDANTSYGAVGLDTAGTANTANLQFKVQLVADQGDSSTNKEWLYDTSGTLTFPRDAIANTDPVLKMYGGESPGIASIDSSLAGPANFEINALNTVFSGYTSNTVTIHPDDGTISSFDTNITIQTSGGVPNSTSNINSQGGYNTGTYTNLSTTGGSGTGLRVNASTAGNGYINTVTINTPGSGYTEGDTITLVGGDGLGCTFTIGVSVNNWEFGTSGNLTLPGNTFAVNYANGTQVSIGGGGANTGNVTFNDVTVQGDNTSLNLSAGADFTANLAYLQVRAGDVASHIHLDTGNNEAYDQYFGNDNKFVKLGLGIAGNVSIGTYQDGGVGQLEWTFDSNGNLVLPRGGVVYETNIPFGGLEGNTIALKPSGGSNADQQLLVYPTAGGDNNHLHLTSGNLYNTELFLGNDNLYVKLANTGDVVINSNDDTGNTGQWIFGTDGNLSVPGNTLIYTPIATSGAGGNSITIQAGSSDSFASNPGGNLNLIGGYGSFGDGGGPPGGNVNIVSGDSSDSHAGNVTIATGSNDWIFDYTGNLTLPTVSLGESTDEQAVIRGQRKIIPSFRWSAVISGGTPTVVYTVSSNNITSMKVTMQIQHTGLGMELFDVYATYAGADTFYTVSNRVAPPTIDESGVVVDLNGSNQMQITVEINSGAATSWVTYDSTEFGIPND